MIAILCNPKCNLWDTCIIRRKRTYLHAYVIPRGFFSPLPMCNHNFLLPFMQHPGNIAVDDVNGGRLIFYDFGMMGR